MRRALDIDEHSFGKDHPAVARDLNNLAQLLEATNRHGEAEPLMRRALVISEQSLGPDHPSVSGALNELAQLLKATDRLAEAEPLMRRALDISEQSPGTRPPRRRHKPQQPGEVAAGHQPARGGGTADAANGGDIRKVHSRHGAPASALAGCHRQLRRAAPGHGAQSGGDHGDAAQDGSGIARGDSDMFIGNGQARVERGPDAEVGSIGVQTSQAAAFRCWVETGFRA